MLLDLFLGDENGLEALPLLVHESPYAKIIVMSAQGTIELAVGAMEKGASSFISKSKDPKELVASLKQKLQSDSETSASEPAVRGETHGFVGNHPMLLKVLTKVEQVKDIDSIVLVTGESGTGKELVARAIHKASARAKEPDSRR